MRFTAVFIAVVWYSLSTYAAKTKPNIVFIFTDDQDLRHGSVDYQKAVQKHLVAKGTVFTNYYATVAVCCPSRVSLMRGQAAHNTNNTNIKAPGGGYPKFVALGENDNYLPHWLDKAGYNAEYVGKLFNGNSLLNYSPGPQGWRHIDVLLDPYINTHNTVVMSENGARPKIYRGFHQTDVMRIKALSRLESLIEEEDPFFLMISPTAPHVENLRDPPTPASRHIDTFAGSTVLRTPNFNPPYKYQKHKPSWLRGLPSLNSSQIGEIDHLYQRRIEALQSVDDIIEDVVKMLEDKGVIDNTYIIYSTDQGYHLGTHRHVGKLLSYVEDTNIPLIVRGPGVKKGIVSHTPSTVTDFAPTFLEIAGLPKKHQPSFLDGASLLKAWMSPSNPKLAEKKEAINVEFWGTAFTELKLWADGDYAPYFPGLYLENDYKTMRYVAEKSSWMYSRWCTNDTELYNTLDDPYELNNLANSTDPHIQRVKSRLNALLLVTKSCAESTCRQPWKVIQPPNLRHGKEIQTLDDALDAKYDKYYASFPPVNIDECLGYQFTPNEGPFFPPNANQGLGLEYRQSTDNFAYPEPEPVQELAQNDPLGGGWDQRRATLEDLLKKARELTDDEIRNLE
ncbi:arylsulfatase [Dactylonectria macrodidyma]|uniref:Arylsulfatase n=1 Tax=Dactylonectria macrodidyma TaxID=307937 RepID=A0A9P9J1B8_9HYPO|nr:arylsulfatase [Dactylonectria macrodidyma]